MAGTTVGGLRFDLELDSTSLVQSSARAQKAISDLSTRGGDFLKRLSDPMARVGDGFRGIERSADAAGNRMAALGPKVQQLGYQVGDFAVQVASGGSALTAFIQQGSQIAGAFGPAGAVVGALGAVVGAAITSLLNMNKAAEAAPDALDGMITALETAEKSAKTYGDALRGVSTETATLLKSFADIDRAQISNKATAQAADVGEALRQRLVDQINARTSAQGGGDIGFGADAAVAGIKLRQQAIAQSNLVSEAISTAVKTGDTDRLTELVNKYQLVNDETSDLIKSLRELAQKTSGLDTAERQADAARNRKPANGILGDTLAALKRKAESGSLVELDTYNQDQVRETVVAREQAARKLATEQEQAAKKGAALLEQVKNQAEASKRLADATDLGTAAVKRAQIANDDAKRVAEASHTLKGQELEDYKKSSAAIAENERRILALNEAKARGVNAGIWETSGGSFRDAERQSMEAYDKYTRDQIGAGDKQAAAYADAQRDILIQPWKDMASEVTSITEKMFDDLLTNGKASIGDIAKGFGDVVKQTITGTASNLIMMPINTAISSIASKTIDGNQDFTQVASQFGRDHPYLASVGLGATGGYVAGSLYGQLTGKQDTYASTGGALGGAGGAALGMFLGGPAGAAAGGLLGSVGGSFLGGLFGGGKMGNDQSRQDYWTGKAGITYSDSSFSPENRAITSGLGKQLEALQESLGGLGASFDNIGIKLGAGNKSGITVNGKQYGSQEEALPAVIRLLLDATSGLSGSQQTALANTKGRTAQEVLGDVQFAKEFDKLTFAGTAFEAAMRDLNDQFDAAQHKAHELGLDEQALADARAKAVERLQIEKARQDRDLEYTIQGALAADDLQRALLAANARFDQLVDQMKDAGYGQGSIDAVNAARTRAGEQIYEADRKMRQQFDRQLVDTLNNSQLGSTLSGIGQQFDDLAAQAKDLGYSSESLAAIETARVRAQQEAIKQYEQQAVDQQRQIEQQVRGVQGYFQGLIDPLKSVIANDNRLSPIGQISQARDSFRETLALAQGGDVEAIRALSSQAQTLKGLSGQYLGSGGLGGEIAAEVRRGLESVVGGLQDQERNALLSFPDVVRETTAEQIRVMIEQFDRLVDEQARTRRELENLRPAA